MNRLLKESDPTILRQALTLLESENRHLGEKLAEMTAQLAAPKREDASPTSRVAP